ncbi:MAG: hypothetical protein M1113_00545 [Candidatus Thermoplasmatota archaeon]|nr:hypothetical protein [Candidatus Thermoplasmatota archaeon]
MLDSDESSGSMLKGIIATFLSMLILGPFMGIGWILSGLFGGIASRGGIRGFAAGLIGGIVLALILIEISYYVAPSTITQIMSYTGNFYFVNNIKTIYLETRQQLVVDPLHTIISVVAEGAIVPAVGGLIGGFFLSRDSD